MPAACQKSDPVTLQTHLQSRFYEHPARILVCLNAYNRILAFYYLCTAFYSGNFHRQNALGPSCD